MTLTKPKVQAEEKSPLPRLDFYHLFWAFFCAAFLGAMIETIFMLATRGVLMNRSGVLYGQFSLVWGVGAVLFTLLLWPLQKYGSLSLFLGGCAVGTLFEYLCSWLQEALFGLRFWNYSHLPLNINGRVCLIFSIFWGLAALLWMRAVWPALCRLLNRPRHPSRVVTRVLVVLMALNVVLTAAALMRMDARLHGTPPGNPVDAFLDQCYPDEMLFHYFTNVKYIN